MADYSEPPSHFSANVHAAGSHLERTPSTEADDGRADLEIKRPRACDPCRQLKVRCDPDPARPDGACKRCAKARRQCIVTAPTRKRQKKTDSRVTELERKIDALTATLQAGQHGQHNPSPSLGAPSSSQSSSRRWLHEVPNGAGTKRPYEEIDTSQYPPNHPDSTQQSSSQTDARHWRRPLAGGFAPPFAKPTVEADYVDVIDRGMISLEVASASFDRYVKDMAEEMPVVVFPPGTTMDDVRRGKPALFLSVISVAVGKFDKEIQMPLITDFFRLAAESIVVKGNKSLELVQALLVQAIWYIPPDNLEELKFYQIIHMAIAVSMDLGLNRLSNGDIKPLARLRDIIAKKHFGPAVDLDGPEARRTWLGCYFLGVQVSTALRRIHLVRWQPYMDECIQILENHPDALPSDRRLVWWAKLGWIMEQAGLQLLPEDSKSITAFADSKYRKDIPEEFWTTPLAHTYYAMVLFVHESAMGVDCRDESNSTNGKLPPAAIAPYVDALSSCIHAIHKTLDTISNVDVERFTNLPTLAVARTAYPVVSLVKIYSLITAPGSRISQIVDQDSLKVQEYLEKVIDHYRAAAALNAGRVAAKFGNILMMLRNWFMKKKENGPELREIFGTETRSDTPSDRARNTPLHVLSELAMDSSRPPATSSPRGKKAVFSPPRLNQERTQNRGASSHAHTMGSITSSRSEPSPAPANPTWPTPSFSPPIPGSHDPSVTGSRPLYQQFPNADSSPVYGMQSQAPSMHNSYMAAPGMGMPIGQSTTMAPEMPMDGALNTDNLFAIGNIIEEGLFSFPFAFDGNFQF
ncbi:hypothetical protein N7470_006866 [Penicillium chermesinum]|nr:hypothetical protein N7470_006866 [Penicillium chermesinum]